MEQEKFESWAIVELMGHSRIVGMCTEHSFGGKTLIRVDVPPTKHMEAFTRFINPDAVYALNPCTEETARKVAESMRQRPIELYDIERSVEKILRLQLAEKQTDTNTKEEDFNPDF